MEPETRSQTDEPATNRRFAWFEPAALAVVGLILVFAGNDSISLWDRDEPRYAQTARNMSETGDWIVPYFNGEFRFQKPVLTYWTVAAGYRLFGDNLFGARFASGICVVAATLVVWSLGNRMFGRPAGVLAGAMFLLSPLTVFLGKLCIPDGLQLVCSTVCFASLWRLVDPDERDANAQSRAAFTLWIFLGLAVLTKGPVVPGMVAATLLGYCVLTRQSPRRFPLRVGTGILVFALVAAPWFLAIQMTAGSAFYSEAVGRQLGGRLAESFDGKLQPPGYYAASLFLGFAPWLAIALHSLVRMHRQCRTPGPTAFLAAWILGPMVLLEMFRSKQFHYYAPAYPALALIGAGYLSAVAREKVQWVRGRHAAAFQILWFGLNLAAVGSLIALGLLAPESVRLPCFLLSATVAVGTIIAAKSWRRRPLHAVAVHSIALAALWGGVGAVVLPRLDSLRVLPAVAGRLQAEQHSRDARPLLHQVIEPSLSYYSGLELPSQLEDEKFLRQVRIASQPTLTVLDERSLERLKPRLQERLKVLDSWRGWVKMHPDTVHLVLIEPLRPETQRPEQIAAPAQRAVSR